MVDAQADVYLTVDISILMVVAQAAQAEVNVMVNVMFHIVNFMVDI